jgi:ATP phosphoribosyltransferase
VRVLKIAIPNKGRLREPTLALLQSAGIKPLASDERALIVPTSWKDVQLVMLRTEDIPSIVEAGAAHIGVTGLDYVRESEAEVEHLVKLNFGVSQIVLAIPVGWREEAILNGSRELRIATKYYNIATDYVKSKGLKAKLVKISGAAEVMPSLGAADAIIDVMSTGTTLRLHGLKPVDVIMESYALIIGNKDWLRCEEAERINMVLTMIKGATEAKGKKMIFMNVSHDNLNRVISSLPAMVAPAVTKLSSGDMWEVITVADEDDLAETIAKAKSGGAKDIVVIDIEKVIR